MAKKPTDTNPEPGGGFPPHVCAPEEPTDDVPPADPQEPAK